MKVLNTFRLKMHHNSLVPFVCFVYADCSTRVKTNANRYLIRKTQMEFDQQFQQFQMGIPWMDPGKLIAIVFFGDHGRLLQVRVCHFFITVFVSK